MNAKAKKKLTPQQRIKISAAHSAEWLLGYHDENTASYDKLHHDEIASEKDRLTAKEFVDGRTQADEDFTNETLKSLNLPD